MSADVVLVTMPWDTILAPSIALGILEETLRLAGVSVQSASLKLAWMQYIVDHQQHDNAFTTDDFEAVTTGSSGIGDWVFALPPVAAHSAAEDELFLARYRAGEGFDAPIDKLPPLRALVPGFVAQCVSELLALQPRIVGFTTTFSQNLASLLLASQLKRAAPHVHIVFGGANCEGPMGAALLRSFDFIDVVVRGPGEHVLLALVQDLLGDGHIRPRPGLCIRRGAELAIVDGVPESPPMDEVPQPRYDEFFARLGTTSFADDVRDRLFLPFETARGCWWGERSHCTFCGLNGSTMRFRASSVDVALRRILELARRHRMVELQAVDNIIALEHLDELLPRLAAEGVDLRLFYEVKPNLKRHQVAGLAAAGVRRIQPGIESLSTPILTLMRKGVTAFDNLRLLKWCAEYGVSPGWNLVFAIPDEPADEYARMTALFPSLHHLDPPQLSPLSVERWSPYHREPARHHIELLGARWFYRHIYSLDDATLMDLAYRFEFRYLDDRRREEYLPPWIAAVQAWQAARADAPALRYVRGPGFVRVEDRRGSDGDYVLEGAEAAIFLACVDGISTAALTRKLAGEPLSTTEMIATLESMVEAGLVYREGERWLGLALPTAPRPVAASLTVEPAHTPGQLVPARALIAQARI
jgi:ribosomal peptide maturation radical SAM protein 1